eukprot:319577_1
MDCCSCKDSSCSQQSKFIQMMKIFDTALNKIHGAELCDVHDILNCFIHLLHQHDSDEQFESIRKQLPSCDISKCNIFLHVHRRRSLSNSMDHHKKHTNSFQFDILCKMHCYYHHSHDAGYRLSNEDRISINTDQDVKEDTTLCTKPIHPSNTDTQCKYSARIMDTKSNRYNQFQLPLTNIKHNEYKFGFLFEYGYGLYLSTEYDENVVVVSPKYSTLKEEIISNPICNLSVDQFTTEYGKADAHFATNYCKQAFHRVKGNVHTYSFSVQHILSLMIYCNYNEFQYKLSKTYRANNGMDHTNFYQIGVYLKQSVRSFGTTIRDGDISIFYHGISEALSFPAYVNHVRVYGPLSSTCSRTAATNFTNINHGIIIEFGDTKHAQSTSPKYFSCSWLSDFTAESEYLFLQNRASVQIHNIIDTKLGHEYMKLLNVLKDIQMLTTIRTVPQLRLLSSTKTITKVISSQLSRKHVLPSYLDYALYHKRYPFMLDLLGHTLTLNALHTIYTNIKRITMENVSLESTLLDDILNYFVTNGSVSNLKRIVIRDVLPESKLNMLQTVEQYQTKYNQQHINLYMDLDRLFLDIDQSEPAVDSCRANASKVEQWTNNDLVSWLESLDLSENWKETAMTAIQDTGCCGNDLLKMRNGRELGTFLNIKQPMLFNRIFRMLMEKSRGNIIETKLNVEEETYFELNIFGQSKYWRIDEKVTKHTTIRRVVELYRIQSAVNTAVETIHLISKGKVLKHTETLEQYGITNGRHLIGVRFHVTGGSRHNLNVMLQ